MIDIHNTIKNLIEQSLDELGYSGDSFVLEHPGDLDNGDYSTNIAMVLSKKIGKNPKDMAVQISDTLNKNKIQEIEKIEVAGAGFINFYLSKDFFGDSIQAIVGSEHWGNSKLLENKKVLVEHSSPNLFKPFHIGHVMNNAIGESITRLAQSGGAAVTAISYPSDVSLGIGKAIYVFLQKGIERVLEYKTLQEKLAFLGDCYVEGTKLYDENEEVQKEVRSITQKIFEHSEGLEWDAYLIGKEINLDYFKSITKTLGSNFDGFIYESEAGKIGKEIVLSHTPDIFTKSDGAVIYEGEKDGLHTRVFINKEGNPTYEAKDIGLVSLKFERFSPDVSIYITDAEQTSYFQVMLSAAGKIHADWQSKSVHRTHGRMTFKGQKMSSRLGGVPTAKDTLDTLKEVVKEVAKHELSDQDIECIAIAALKYTILRTQAGKNINFDPETSLSFEGDSGPYLLYSAIRAKSILEKGEYKSGTVSRDVDLEILHLEKLLYRFREIVERSLREYAPHHLVIYLTELASAFNAFYAQNSILVDTNIHKDYHLVLVESFYKTMKNGLHLLGITLPSKM